MPTENEYKYLLGRDDATLSSLHQYWQDQIHWSQSAYGSIIEIEQGLLTSDAGLTLRVRRAVPYAEKKKVHWLLTLKKDVGDRVVEVEYELSDRDGEDLWAQCHSKLKKTRYNLRYLGQKWEVDRFFDGDRVYCVLAEIELPEGAPPPETLPPFIAEHLLFAVPQSDGRFSNKKLWHIPTTDSLYDEYSDEACV